MRFSLEHRFAAAVEAVERAVLDPGYQELLTDLPNVGERRVTEFEERPDGSVKRITHYRLGSQVPAPVAAVLGNTATWDEIAEFDPSSHEWTFEIRPHVLSGRIQCHGRYSFTPSGDGTKRVVEVDVRVKVPLVGGRAEREIKKGLTETMDAEAELLAEFLEGRSG